MLYSLTTDEKLNYNPPNALKDISLTGAHENRSLYLTNTTLSGQTGSVNVTT